MKIGRFVKFLTANDMNLSRWILKLAGWKSVYQVEEPAKSVICVAPHTRNWDFIIAK